MSLTCCKQMQGTKAAISTCQDTIRRGGESPCFFPLQSSYCVPAKHRALIAADGSDQKGIRSSEIILFLKTGAIKTWQFTKTSKSSHYCAYSRSVPTGCYNGAFIKPSKHKTPGSPKRSSSLDHQEINPYIQSV